MRVALGFAALAHSVEVLLPAQRYVFALENGRAVPQPASTSEEGFHSYKKLQREGKVAGMIAIPNCCLIRAGEDYVVDPGVMMQGAPVTASLRERGIEPHETKVILTHTHFDHVQALIEFGAARDLRARDRDARRRTRRSSRTSSTWCAPIELTGDEGEIEPGVRWIVTPGHSDGLISLLVDTDDGLVVIASDCVGPLPEYFENMDLPQDFGPERDELLRQWQRIRELDPHIGHPGAQPPGGPEVDKAMPAQDEELPSTLKRSREEGPAHIPEGARQRPRAVPAARSARIAPRGTRSSTSPRRRATAGC